MLKTRARKLGIKVGGGGAVTNLPAGAFSTAPSISPAGGNVGTVFVGYDGTFTGTIASRQWLLNGSPIGGATGSAYTSTAAGTLTYRVTLVGGAVSTSAAVTVIDASGSGATAPTLTKTSSSGGNPLRWSSDYTDMIVDSDYITMQWRVNGGAATTETPHLFTTDDWYDSIDGTFTITWPTYEAAVPFAGGAFVEVREGVQRGAASPVWSAWLSDTMSAAAWTPASLPVGKKPVLWLKGDTLTGSDGSDLNSWADASGNSNNGTASTTVSGVKPILKTAFLNSMNVVYNNTSGFNLPAAVAQSLTSAAGFALCKRDADPPGGDTQAGPIFGRFSDAANISHDPYTDGVVYDSFMSTTRKTTVNPTDSLASWALVGFRSAASDWRFDVNAVNVYNTTTNTVASNSSVAAGTGYDPKIGFGLNSGNEFFFVGHFAEIVFCPDFLTTAEKEKVEGYLAWKWGKQSLLPVGHTYKSAAP